MVPQMRRRVITIAIIAFILGLLIINSLFSHANVKTISYSTLLRDAKSQSVVSATINNSNGVISGQLSNGT
ncbi:MAG TPA: ATP-dependent metallopeptidase FtsH/Yme1/Tma family protein, partial [Acidimicrobiales bacterium]|nr:ATP-dependent metallopeptidase FtsH/Yme1/Tma family protein [Acidimicrobiales bacterium]